LSRQLRGLVVFLLAAVLAVILLDVFPPVQVARVYLLALVALAGAVVAGRTLSRFGRLERVPPQPSLDVPGETPAFFERAIRRIELANASGVYFEQLRPRLREIAEQRLGAHGLRLRSDEARQLLGEDVWLALERRSERDKFEPPREGELEAVIAALERV
jgi:hypothetical protein